MADTAAPEAGRFGAAQVPVILGVPVLGALQLQVGIS